MSSLIMEDNKVSSSAVYTRGRHIKKYLLMMSDLIALFLAIVMGYFFSIVVKYVVFNESHNHTVFDDINSQLVFFLFPVVFFVFSSKSKGHYSRSRPFWDEYKDIIKITLLIMGFLMAYLYVIKSHFSRLWFFSAWLTVILLIPISRILIRKIMIKMNIWYVPTLFFGDCKSLMSAKTLEEDYYLGNRIIAIYQTGGNNKSSYIGQNLEYEDIGSLDRPAIDILSKYGDPQIIVHMSARNHFEDVKIIEKFSPHTDNLSIIPAVGDIPLYGAETYHIFSQDLLIMRLKNNLSKAWPKLLKRAFDVVVSLLLILILFPLLLMVSLLVKKDGGSVFFGHKRIGYNRKPFQCYKFRSMAVNSQELLHELLTNNIEAREEWEKDFKLKDDPRITRIGSFIRKSSIDELPQLWNVIRGDMSLVGPRPVVAEELERYGDKSSFYIGTKPGITGLWQVSGRNDIDYKRRVELDAWYVRNWSLWYDMVILVKTIKVVFGKKGAY